MSAVANGAAVAERPKTGSTDDLAALVEQLVDTFPALSDEDKREFGKLLAPSTT